VHCSWQISFALRPPVFQAKPVFSSVKTGITPYISRPRAAAQWFAARP
jgi:hypothetical protein